MRTLQWLALASLMVLAACSMLGLGQSPTEYDVTVCYAVASGTVQPPPTCATRRQSMPSGLVPIVTLMQIYAQPYLLQTKQLHDCTLETYNKADVNGAMTVTGTAHCMLDRPKPAPPMPVDVALTMTVAPVAPPPTT